MAWIPVQNSVFKNQFCDCDIDYLLVSVKLELLVVVHEAPSRFENGVVPRVNVIEQIVILFPVKGETTSFQISVE